jgi:hypothetical protein
MQDMVIEIVIMAFITTDHRPELILCGHSLGAGVAVLLAMVKVTKL